MKRSIQWLGISAVIAMSASCGSMGFSLQERWEGWRDDRVRIYVEVRKSDSETGQDDGEIEPSPDAEYIRMAAERAALLSAQMKYSATDAGGNQSFSRQIDQSTAKVVYKKCDDSRCQAFVDFRYAGTAQ